LERKGEDTWDGVRNYQARNFLKLMGLGDQVLIYHSGTEKALVGLAQVSQSAFPDPQDEAWVAVKLQAIQPLSNPVTLSQQQQRQHQWRRHLQRRQHHHQRRHHPRQRL
jgi:predicted RNA-binding protein with PUA-like domain